MPAVCESPSRGNKIFSYVKPCGVIARLREARGETRTPKRGAAEEGQEKADPKYGNALAYLIENLRGLGDQGVVRGNAALAIADAGGGCGGNSKRWR